MRFALILFTGIMIVTFAPFSPVLIVAGLILMAIFADDMAPDS
jgi:hypothetical protein